MSIVAYYGKDQKRGAEACDELSASRAMSNRISNVINNRKWYDGYLFATELLQKYTSESLGTGEWSPMNPSIVTLDEKVVLNVRFVNYKVSNTPSALSYDRGDIRTCNLLIADWKSTDSTLACASQVSYKTLLHAPSESNRIQGYEDLRLFTLNKKVHAIATVFEDSGRNRMHIVRANDEITEWLPSYSSHINIGSDLKFEYQGCEKNWLPFHHNQDFLQVVYHFDHPRTLHVEIDEKKPPFVSRVTANESGADFLIGTTKMSLIGARGSSGGFPFMDGFLFLVHFVGFEQSKRVYFQRFVLIHKENLRVTHISHLFKFSEEAIEIPSITTCPWNDSKLVLALGVNDSHLEMRYIEKEKIVSSLRSITV